MQLTTDKEHFPGSKAAPWTRICGIVMRQGRPVKTGWAALLRIPTRSKREQCNLFRGRKIQCALVVYSIAAIRNGAYALDVPYQNDNWWVVTFNGTGINAEAGSRCVSPYPEVPRGIDIPRELWNAPAEPWKGAIVVKVEADKDISGVKLGLPAE